MRFFAKLKELLRDKSMDPPPPRPPGWNKTQDDLDKQKSYTSNEMHWAREYERDGLKKWARFPLDGEVYAANTEVEVSYITYWRAPYSEGGKARLPAGTRVRVKTWDKDPEPVSVEAMPEDAALEERIVPEHDRRNPKYQTYCLYIKVALLNREFTRVDAPQLAAW